MKHKQMKSPFTGGAVQSVIERQTVLFKQENFEMDVETLVCVDTGRRFTTGEMDDAFVDQLHRLWRERHRMPTTEQLRAVREQLGLSMREMSKLLGFGINQYRLYEEGELPTGSNLLLLRLLVDPSALTHIITTQADTLPVKTRKALDKWLQEKSLPGTKTHALPGRKPAATRT
jgi:DNA-binding transcriptional regulator YiaG